MKRYLMALCALVLAVGFSAFSPKFALRYIVYDGSGAENSFSNYAVQSTSPGTLSSSTTIWWFRVDDALLLPMNLTTPIFLLLIPIVTVS